MLYDKRWELDAAGKVLWDAAALLEAEGWTQCCSQNGKGERCLLWAIYEIENDQLPDSMQGKEVRRRLRNAIGHPMPMVWNDMRGRKKEEVIGALRKAALGG